MRPLRLCEPCRRGLVNLLAAILVVDVTLSLNTIAFSLRRHHFVPVLRACAFSMEDRDVRLVRLGIEGLDIAYKPGDVAYILPRNRPTAVDSFLELFGLDGEQIIDVTGEGLWF